MECRETPCKLVPSAVVRCLTPTTDLETFDDLRLAAFNSNSLKMDFERENSLHISQSKKAYGAYYQQQLWIQASLKDVSLEMNAESYGFTL